MKRKLFILLIGGIVWFGPAVFAQERYGLNPFSFIWVIFIGPATVAAVLTYLNENIK